MNRIPENSNRISLFLKSLVWLSIAGVISTFPYITWYLFGKYYIVFSTLISVLLCGLTFYYASKTGTLLFDRWAIVLLFFWLSVLVYSIFSTIQHAGYYDIRRLMGVSFKVLIIMSIIFLFKTKGAYRYCLDVFFKLNVLITVLSIILFILLFIGIEIEPVRFMKIDNRYHNFYWIGATNAVFKFNTTVIRIAGFADEPGALALILTYLLVINEFTLKNNFYRIILSIGGFFTFSIAFIITFVPVLLYWLIKPVVKFRHFVITALAGAVVIFVACKMLPDIDYAVDNLVLNRFESSENGTIQGDNRSWAVPFQLKAFEKYPLFGTSINPDLVEKYELGQPNFFSFLGIWGIYGYLFFYIPYLLLILMWINRKELLLLLAIGLIFLQRPGIEETFTLFCFTLIYYSRNYQFSLSTQKLCKA